MNDKMHLSAPAPDQHPGGRLVHYGGSQTYLRLSERTQGTTWRTSTGYTQSGAGA